jgi:hypothetical protein
VWLLKLICLCDTQFHWFRGRTIFLPRILLPENLEFWEAVVFAFLGVFPAAVSCPSGRVKSVPPLISEAMLRAPTVKSDPRGVSPEPIEVCDTLGPFGALDPSLSDGFGPGFFRVFVFIDGTLTNRGPKENRIAHQKEEDNGLLSLCAPCRANAG